MPKKKRGKTRATKVSAGELGHVGHSDINLEALQQSLRDAVTVVAPRGSAHHAESEELADEFRPAAHRVCRHMLDGGCFRSDCPFSHDVSGVPCRYFGTPMGCRNGPSCPFLHHESAIRTPVGPAASASAQDTSSSLGAQIDTQAQHSGSGFGSWAMQAPEQLGAQWDFVSGVTPTPLPGAGFAGSGIPTPSGGSLPTLPQKPVDWSTSVPYTSTSSSTVHAPPPSVTAALASAAESSLPWDGPAVANASAPSSAHAQWGQPSASQSIQPPPQDTWGVPTGPSTSPAPGQTQLQDQGDGPGDGQGGHTAEHAADDMVLAEEDSLPFEGDDLDWLLQMAADATDAAHAAKAAAGGGESAEHPPTHPTAPPSPTLQSQSRSTAQSRPAPKIFLGPIPYWVVQDVADMEGVQGGSKPSPPTAADFPALGGRKEEASGATGASTAGRESEGGSVWAAGAGSADSQDGPRLSLSDKLKLQWLVDAVAQGMKEGGINDPRRGDASVVLRAFLECGRDLDAAREALQRQLDISIAVQRADKVQAETYQTFEKYAGGTAGMTAEARRAAAAAAKRLKWVDTGVGVNATYKSARGDAERFAVARNRCFGRATEAYLAGKGAAARAWSKEGRTWDAKMRQAHARAAATIFAQRNAAMGGNDGLLSVDVHGLHPDEAVQVTENAMRNAGGAQWLAVIMGTGHHSSGSRSVLVDELKRWAERTHVSWFEGGAGAGQGGVMMIQLTR